MNLPLNALRAFEVSARLRPQHATEAEALVDAPLSPVCAPALARRLRAPADLLGESLLRSYRADEWSHWFAAAGVAAPLLRGPVFDSSLTMSAAMRDFRQWLMGEVSAGGRPPVSAPAAASGHPSRRAG